MTPYVTVFNKATGEGHRIYRSSLREFMATGDYTLEAPPNAKPDDSLRRSKLPTAGREMNREPIAAEAKAEVAGEPEAIEAPVEDKPAKPAPKRRSPAAEE